MTDKAAPHDVPLRLAQAVAVAFPHGGMTVEMLQKVYGHHHPEHQSGVLAAIGGRK